MGLGLFGGSSSAGRTTSSKRVSSGRAPTPGDPVPERFEIRAMVEAGGLTVADIVWPDAKNFDGRKVAVYRASRYELAAATRLDPHFQEERGKLVPIARFEPTEEGWRMAIDFCDMMVAK